MNFNDTQVDAKYLTDNQSDQVVHVPGGRNGNGWKGNLSRIPLDAADRLFAMKSNLIKLKTETPAADKLKDNKKNKPEADRLAEQTQS